VSIISSNLYKALKEAGVKDELAEQVREDFIVLDKKIDNISVEQDKKFEELKNEAKILNTKFNILMGLNIAMFTTMIGVLFTVVLIAIHK